MDCMCIQLRLVICFDETRCHVRRRHLSCFGASVCAVHGDVTAYVKTRDVALGVEWLQRTTYDVGMVLLDIGSTDKQVCVMPVLSALLSIDAPQRGCLVELSDPDR